MSQRQTPGYFLKEFKFQFFQCEEEEEEEEETEGSRTQGRRRVECVKAGSTTSSVHFFSSARCPIVANLLNTRDVVFPLSCSINVLNQKMHPLTVYILPHHHSYHYLLHLQMYLFLFYVHECFTLCVCLCTTCMPGASIDQNRRSYLLDLELQMVVSCHKRSKNSEPVLLIDEPPLKPHSASLISCKIALVLMSTNPQYINTSHKPYCIQKVIPICGEPG